MFIVPLDTNVDRSAYEPFCAKYIRSACAMATRSFCTPVKLMACVATIPGPGAACFKKNRYPPTLIAATISKLINPFMTQLYAGAYSVRRWQSRMCGSGQPLAWIVSDHPIKWEGCVSERVAVGRKSERSATAPASRT